MDDYNDELNEVAGDQGVAFPFSRGLWLICHLVSAINPDDLDAIDESVPFTKHTLDMLFGRIHSAEEYRYYFESNPHGSQYHHHFDRFATENVTAKNILAEL